MDVPFQLRGVLEPQDAGAGVLQSGRRAIHSSSHVQAHGMGLAGPPKAQMIESIRAGFDNKDLPTPEPGAMCYMMSRDGYLSDALGHHVPHLMFYFPVTDNPSWGADLPNSPVTLNPQFQDGPEPIAEFVIPVGKWSDGTAAPTM